MKLSFISNSIRALFLGLALTGCSAVGNSTSTIFEPSKDFVRTYEDISPEEENVIGRAVAARILGEHKVYSRKEFTEYLAQIGVVLAAASDRPDPFSGYSFVILDTNQVNAMAAPGGYIFITKGMLDKIQDEDQLASVLAHEIAHISQRHGLQAIKPQNLGTFIEVGGVLLSAIDCSGLSQQMALAFSKAIGDIVDKLMTSGYTKEQEYEADKIALQILQKAGYDSKGMKGILHELSTVKDTGQGWFGTHPSPNARLAEVEPLIKNNPASASGFEARKARFKKLK